MLDAAPFWACVGRRFGLEFRCEAAPPRASGAPTRIYHLIVCIGPTGAIEVREEPGHRLLPAFCPQRHMNENGSFCIGFRAGNLVTGAQRAAAWWNKLQVFLTCQETAHQTRTWPQRLEISHGAAGEIELLGEEVAESLGMRAEFEEAVQSNTGPIAYFVRRINKNTGHLLNGRAICPCGRKDRQDRPKLRRQCWKAGYLCLPMLERQRREAERTFWRNLKARVTCCGTMDDCPLNTGR